MSSLAWPFGSGFGGRPRFWEDLDASAFATRLAEVLLVFLAANYPPTIAMEIGSLAAGGMMVGPAILTAW